jgi:hypothetical protein
MAKAVTAQVPTAATPSVDDALFDSRVVDRHIKEGRTTQAAYESYLSSLPDESEECVQSDVRFHVRGRILATPGVDEEEN